MLPLGPIGLYPIRGLFIIKILDIIIDYLNKNKLKKILKENKNNAISSKIEKFKKEGNYNKIEIGLYDENENKIEELNLEAEEVSSDIRTGQVYYLN